MSARRLLAVVFASCLASCVSLAMLSAPALAAGPPVLEEGGASEWSEGVAVTGATIAAKVNPNEVDTTYHFEYGTDTSYGMSVPVPDADIGAGSEWVTVHQPLSGLQPGTSYHYRVVARNANGVTDGPDTTFITWPAPTVTQPDGCPNAAYRVGGLSANLPDCRAYEMVSPLDKNDDDVVGDANAFLASESGDRVAYASRVGFGDTRGTGAVGETQYVASRGATAWSTHAITPTPLVQGVLVFSGETIAWAFDSELHHTLIQGLALPGVTGGLPESVNLYRENVDSNALETVTTPWQAEPFSLSNVSALSASLRGYSSDLGVITFETSVNLLPQTIGSQTKLYAWDHGALTLAGLLPGDVVPSGGSASPGQLPEAAERDNTVSRDGSKILFYSPASGSGQQLYMRRNGTETVWVSQSEASAPNPEPQNVTFESASPDLSKVVFASTDRLLDNDPGGPGYGLYLYTDGPKPETESNLTFIARISNAGGRSVVPGISEDGSHIYFTSEEMAGLPLGDGFGEDLYLWDSGTLRFVTSQFQVAANSIPGVGDTGSSDNVLVSADGKRIAFLDERQLTNQDTGRDPFFFGAKFAAMYVYDESSQTLNCVSCPPSHAAATSNAVVAPFATTGVEIGLPFRHHFLSSDGRYVFFSTADALVPQDTNGLYDVYEYDTDRSTVALLSSGTGENGSWFVDASPSGHDAFFVTRQSLSGRDTDKLVDMYDARVDGGLPEPARAPVPCAGDACQGVPSAVPSFNTSSGFNGLGNVAPSVKPKKKVTSVKSLSRLARALKACRRKAGKKRHTCEVRARKRYGARQSVATRTAHRAGR